MIWYPFIHDHLQHLGNLQTTQQIRLQVVLLRIIFSLQSAGNGH